MFFRATFTLAIFAAAMIPQSAAAAPLVRIDSGPVAGTTADGVESFKGIPYAMPPVGDLRWRAPQPAAKWSRTFEATQFGHDCMQVPYDRDLVNVRTKPAEDCLVVNVWKPAHASGKLPVAVWIYGGGYINGGSSVPIYDGAQFAKQGVIFVTFNYRLGRLGFFAHPALTAAKEGPLGNYGVLDQIAALQWVKRDIAAFGGDPAQVTLMGESAGGDSVMNLMASPLAQGLFQRAIVESGGGRREAGGYPLLNPSRAETMGMNFAQTIGVQGTGPEALAALRALPAEKIRGDLNLLTLFHAVNTYDGGPMIDGTILANSSDQIMRAGEAAKIPVLIGTNSMDIGVGGAKITSKDELFASFGAAAQEARAAYDPDGKASFASLKTEAARDRGMHEPARFVATVATKAGQDAWVYRFGYVAQSMRAQWAGVPHFEDVPFFFDNLAAKYGTAVTEQDADEALLAHQYFVNFIKSGNPNAPGLPVWQKFDPATDPVMFFNPDGGASSMPDPLKPRLDAAEAAVGG